MAPASRFEVRVVSTSPDRFGIFDTDEREFVDARLTKPERANRELAQRLCNKWNRYNGPPVEGLSDLLRLS